MTVRTLLHALLLALAVTAAPSVGMAQTPEATEGIPGVAPGTPPPADEVEALTDEVASGLRCPVCQGLSVNDSSSRPAVQMKERIRELVAAGYDQRTIEDFFVGRYGEWVLLDPRAGGLNQLVWLGPLVAFGLGLVVVGGFAARRPEDDVGPDTVVDERPTAAATMTDPHLARLLSEVDRD